jgi:protein gp37
MAHRFHRDFTPHWVERNFRRAMPRKPSRIFVNSMSDVADWKDEWFDRVTCIIAAHPEHLFLFLSKRPWAAPWTSLPNTLLGYSVTRQADLDALLLNGGPGDVSFLSIEPLLDRVEAPTLWMPRWIIVGAETGHRKEKVRPALSWLFDILRYASEYHIPLFFKDSLREQWGDDDAFPQAFPLLEGA